MALDITTIRVRAIAAPSPAVQWAAQQQQDVLDLCDEVNEWREIAADLGEALIAVIRGTGPEAVASALTVLIRFSSKITELEDVTGLRLAAAPCDPLDDMGVPF